MNEFAKLSHAAQEAASGNLDSFEDELDEYDLLKADGETASSETEGETQGGGRLLEADLAGTTKAFNNRIQRKKKEQEELHGIAEKAARQRHMLMYSALVSIRKALREILRIDLGERFSFTLIADDWFGWPRLIIKLEDLENSENDYPQLMVTAHDRHDAGIIEILFDGTAQPERLSLSQENEPKRLSTALRKCVRTYLDVIGDIVLHAERQQDTEQRDDYLARKDMREFEEKGSGEHPTINADLFEDELGKESLMDTLPSLENVEALPDFGGGKAGGN